MHERIDRLAGMMTRDEAVERDFERRLIDSGTLAFRVAFSVLRHREDAEDVAQDALAKAYRSIGQLRDRERFRAWLVRMTWRLALDRQRANRRRGAHEMVDDAGVARNVVRSDGSERADHLWQAIDRLPEKLRVAIVLSGIEGHDVREVAALLQIPEGTVKSRLFAARERLKRILGGRG